MSPDSKDSHVGVVVEFLNRLQEDLSSGHHHGQEHYQRLYPGYEELIAEEYSRLLSDSAGSDQKTLRAQTSEIPGDIAALAARDVAASKAGVPLPETIGRYRIEAILGRGGQGLVYLAQDPNLPRQVALKQLTHRISASDQDLARFRREAAVVARLDHPGIAPIIEAGHDAGVPFMAMKFVEGRTLRRVIDDTTAEERRRPESIMRTLHLIERIARAAHAANEAGVVHRDLKPGNVMITKSGDPVILDFGLAQDSESVGEGLTETGDVFGSPPYMAPEQIRGQRVDRRADVYALGITLFESLTGHRPFEAATRHELHEKILEHEAPDIRRELPNASRDLSAVIQTALAKEAHRRYATCEDLARDLLAVREGQPVHARPLTRWTRCRRWVRRHPGRAAAAVLVTLLALSLAGVGGFLLARWDILEAGRDALAQREFDETLARAYRDVGEGSPDAALAALRELSKDYKDHPEVTAGMIMALYETHDIDAALAALDAVPDALKLSLAPLRDHARWLSGDTEPPPEPTAKERTPLWCFIAGNAAIIRAHNGDQNAGDEALALLTEAITRSKTVSALYAFARAHAAAHASDPRAAREAADVIISYWPDSATAWYWRGLALAKVAPEDGIEAFRRSIALDPHFGSAHHDLGKLLSDSGAHDEALAAFQRAAEVAPKLAPVWTGLALEYQRRHQIADAETAYHRAIALDPSFGEAYIGLCALLHREERFDEAMVYSTRATEVAPREPRAWFNHGVVLGSLERHKDAAKAYAQLVKLTPNDPAAHRAQGAALIKSGQRRAGLAALDQAAALAPKTASTVRLLGDAYLAAKVPTKAIAWLTKAVELNPRDVESELRLGDALLGTDDANAALVVYDRVCASDPDRAMAWMKRGAALLKLYRILDARDSFERGHTLGKEDPEVKRAYESIVPTLRPYFDVLQQIDGYLAGATLPPLSELGTPFALAKKLGNHLQVAALWERVHAEQSKGWPDGPAPYGIDAIIAAASCGHNDPAPGKTLTLEEQARWRATALRWLVRELAAWEDLLDRDSATRKRAQDGLILLNDAKALAPYRAPGTTFLSEEEKERWDEALDSLEQLVSDL